mmetsp:Transcript_8800/g.21068  ORF Transcript_8800/g.21068 Transcript_8800/m.21068 type:complete len:242 (-) Transcript_8800:392-1117(-)
MRMDVVLVHGNSFLNEAQLGLGNVQLGAQIGLDNIQLGIYFILRWKLLLNGCRQAFSSFDTFIDSMAQSSHGGSLTAGSFTAASQRTSGGRPSKGFLLNLVPRNLLLVSVGKYTTNDHDTHKGTGNGSSLATGLSRTIGIQRNVTNIKAAHATPIQQGRSELFIIKDNFTDFNVVIAELAKELVDIQSIKEIKEPLVGVIVCMKLEFFDRVASDSKNARYQHVCNNDICHISILSFTVFDL